MKTLQNTLPVPQISMKTLFFTLLAALLALGSLSVAVSARAQSAGPTKAGTVATASGALDVYQPGKTLVLKNTDGTTTTYVYGEDVVYATPGGATLTADQAQARMKAGLPMRLEYIPQGGTRVIRRVIVEETTVRED